MKIMQISKNTLQCSLRPVRRVLVTCGRIYGAAHGAGGAEHFVLDLHRETPAILGNRATHRARPQGGRAIVKHSIDAIGKVLGCIGSPGTP